MEHHDKYGWSITHPGDDLLDFVLEAGLTDILIFRNEYSGFSIPGTGAHNAHGEGSLPPKKSNSRKYICPCCKNSVRATKTVNIACLDCEIPMVEV